MHVDVIEIFQSIKRYRQWVVDDIMILRHVARRGDHARKLFGKFAKCTRTSYILHVHTARKRYMEECFKRSCSNYYRIKKQLMKRYTYFQT